MVWFIGFFLILLVVSPKEEKRIPLPIPHMKSRPSVVSDTYESDFPPSTQRPVLILDDLGLNPKTDDEALLLPQNIVLSILPFGKDARRLASEACNRGRLVFVHMPMEPLNPTKDPGPLVIKVGMKFEQVFFRMHLAFEQVPCAQGFNQHMGSRASRHLTTMRYVAKSIRILQVPLIVDSRTIGGSLLCQAAREESLACFTRDLFLDVDNPIESMETRYLRAVQTASGGFSPIIVIAHPHPATLHFLQTLPPQSFANPHAIGRWNFTSWQPNLLSSHFHTSRVHYP